MASGYFPLRKDDLDEDVQKLVSIEKQLDEFLNSIVYDGWDFFSDQTDNAYFDGQYMEKLNLAHRLIKECFYDE